MLFNLLINKYLTELLIIKKHHEFKKLIFSVIAVSLVACGPAVNTTKTTSNDLSIYKRLHIYQIAI
jgi:hypothetical protein